MRSVIFRADASRQIGYGHVMRCLALADALRSQGLRCAFVASSDGAVLADEVIARGHRQITLPFAFEDAETDAAETWKAVSETGEASACVVDHYSLGLPWEILVHQAGIPILAIEDLPRFHQCDWLLDQNVICDTNPYADFTPSQCKHFLGPQYALLRQSFAKLRQEAGVRRNVQRILIFFGGSDESNETAKALQGILSVGGSQLIDVVIGAANPHQAELEKLCAMHSAKVRLHVQTPHMAELMAQADLAIGAGGSASWERCCLRLPAIIAVLADNQMPIAMDLARKGAVLNLGEAAGLTPADYASALAQLDDRLLQNMSEAAGMLVDGQGASRLALELAKSFRSMS